jgi:endonuclease YncB( thermonuclease family)
VVIALSGTLNRVVGGRRPWCVYLALLAPLLTFGPGVLAASEYAGKVVAMAGGDTFTLLVDREELRIRLAEIDTPENGKTNKLPALPRSFGRATR